MAVTITKRILSGSTNGKGVKLTTTAATGVLIHTSVSGTGAKDEIWLYAVNTATSSVKVTGLLGGTTIPDNAVEYSVPGEDGLHLLIPGLPFNNQVAMRAFAGSANVIVLYGFVNRISSG